MSAYLSGDESLRGARPGRRRDGRQGGNITVTGQIEADGAGRSNDGVFFKEVRTG